MNLKATYLGSNGWLIEFPNIKLIIDPWLSGDLIFPPGEWFFKGTLENPIPTPQNINLILLTQGLPDHCHAASLQKLSKEIQVICPKSATKTLEELGFKHIKVIKPSEKVSYQELEIEATCGAPVPQIENGYIIQHKDIGFYIEPHGFLDKAISPRKLEAVITPTKSLNLPLVGPFVKGADVIPQLIKTFDPDYILSSTIGGKAKFSGLLNKFIKVKEFNETINCKQIDLESMESIEI